MPYRKKYPNKKNFAKAVRKVIYSAAETKFYTNQASSGSVGANGSEFLLPLADIDQGDSQTTRSGNQIVATGLYCKGYLTVADSTNVVRIMVVIPKDPSVTILTSETYSSVDADSYTVLYDKLYFLEPGAKSNQAFTIKRSFTKGGSRKGMTIQYNGTLGTDCTKNNIFLFAVSDSGAIAHPQISGSFRLYFKDL